MWRGKCAKIQTFVLLYLFVGTDQFHILCTWGWRYHWMCIPYIYIYIYTHRSVCTYIYIYMSDMSYIMYILHTYNYAYLYGIHWYTVPKSISCNQVWFFCSLDSQQIQARSAGHGLQIPSRTQCTMLRSGLSWFDKYEALSTSLASTWLNGFFGKLYKSNPSTSQNTNKMDVRRVCHSFYSRSPSKGVH